MIPILTPSASAALDRAAADRGVSVDSLMERAGWAVARAVVEAAGGAYGRRAVVVCGKGNNGGDGLVAARYLDRWGMGMTAVLLGRPSASAGPAATNLRRFADAGGRIVEHGTDRLRRELDRADVVVDALFGTGFRGAPDGEPLEAIRAMASCDAAVVAVDIPSGVNGETGAVARDAVVADVTVSFGTLKPGVVLFPGAAHAGEVRVADIGFPPDLIRSDLGLVEPEDAAALLPVRAAEANKRSTGVVLVVAGSRAMTGAGVLTARAAYRAGAGLVTLAVPESALATAKAALTEATFLPLPETEGGGVSEDAWGALAERFDAVHALAVGPGLGRDPATSALVRRLVAESPVPFVLDADGLNAFAGRGDDLARRASDCVVTPHDGEFARLTGAAVDEVREDRIGHARKASSAFGCAVLLKGPRTIVAEPSGRARVNATGGPALATGGTGDVLTGAAAAFVARRLSPADAAVLAAFVHGVAGELAGAESGEGAIASDVLERLPAAVDALRRLREERAGFEDGRSSFPTGVGSAP